MGSRETINVELTPEMAEAVDAAVKSGQFGSASDVVLAALDQWQSGQFIYGYTPEEIDRLVEEGFVSGEPVDGEESFKRLRSRFIQEFGDGA
jgi:antitoxin ParD1/3/4